MKPLRRGIFAALILLMNVASVLAALGVTVLGVRFVALFVNPHNAYDVAAFLAGEMLLGWLAVAIACQLVPPAKQTCSISAITGAVTLDLVAVTIFDASVGGTFVVALSIYCLMHFMVLLSATYWRSSQTVRIVETSVAFAAWLLVLAMRSFGLWRFAPSGQLSAEQHRVAAVVMLVVTAPLLVALLIAFRRDGRVSSPA